MVAEPDERRLISVVIPAYNRESTLQSSLDSLLAQTLTGWEAIVVDDGSGDGTAAVAEEYARRDSRISVRHQVNRGVSAARNVGIAAAGGEWLFFLDADDRIAPTAFENLLSAAEARPEATAIHGGYVYVSADGREVRVARPDESDDLFPLFARTCAIAIQTCLVRTELVRAVGGFDERLVTCEDWDLWQRLARAGAVFAAIPDYIAFYELRAGSSSAQSARMLEDGLVVIGRGHGADERVAAALHPLGAPDEGLASARAYFACYCAGLAMADGSDGRWTLDAITDWASADVAADGLADTLLHAIPTARASIPDDWSSFPAEVLDACRAFIDALGERAGDPRLAPDARRMLERGVISTAAAGSTTTIGSWHRLALECEDAPPAAVRVEADVRGVLCDVRLGGRHLATVEVPALDGWLPARVLADRVAADLAWEIVGARFERDLYSRLETSEDGGRAVITRDGTVVWAGPADGGPRTGSWLHDRAGWTVLLQELLGRPDWDGTELYESPPDDTTDVLELGPDELGTVELTQPLPEVRSGGPVATVAVTIAGVPFTRVRLPVDAGRVAAERLRRTVLIQAGFELCRAVARELILAPAATAEVPLRAVLASAAQRRAALPEEPALGLLPEDGGILIGRRANGADGTGVSRYAVLPAPARAELVRAARHNGEPVRVVGDGDGPVVYAPCLEWARTGAADDESLLRRVAFESTFVTRPDPWEYESDYEQRKYEQTLSLLPRRVGSALELGCAEGIFTARLAERADRVVACDISRTALARAAARLDALDGVSFLQLDVFADRLPAEHDAVVCSETLYYAPSPAHLDHALRAIHAALRPGGVFVTAHAHAVADDPQAPGFDWDVAVGAKGIAKAIVATALFELAREIRTGPYLVQAYRRRNGRRIRLRRPPRITRADAGAMIADAAARYLPEGGEVLSDGAPSGSAGARDVPILMYHHVAPAGSAALRRWRVTPEEFEAQLRFLREAGYYHVTFEEMRAARTLNRGLPGKPIVITFDDGYSGFAEFAAPLLRRHGFGATVYVVTELVGQTNAWDADYGEALRLMDWETIGRLDAEGFGFGSHSRRHRRLVDLAPAELAADLAESRRGLEERLGHGVTTVSYPYGLHDPAVTYAAGACGYEFGVTTNEWRAAWDEPLLELPRLEVYGTFSLRDFQAMLHDR
jgi:peptidoglycan/xylan/chitin deacetylase (PgdA/CDA1 family)